MSCQPVPVKILTVVISRSRHNNFPEADGGIRPVGEARGVRRPTPINLVLVVEGVADPDRTEPRVPQAPPRAADTGRGSREPDPVIRVRRPAKEAGTGVDTQVHRGGVALVDEHEIARVVLA